MRRYLWAVIGLVLLAVLVLSPISASRSGGNGDSPLYTNSSGDGYADLAVGVPREDSDPGIVTVNNAGGVNVLYGLAAGLSATGNQFWSQDSTGIADTAEASDWFGEALAAGDFNGDGYADLAVDVREEDIVTVNNAGGVNILYGSSGGFSATGNQFWSQDSTGIADTAEPGDYFGGALAAGDFDGDGYADLAVGVRYEDIDTVIDAGVVNVLYGSSDGLSATGNQMWHQDSTGIADTAEASDRYGYALAAGDFDGDGYADLAVGVPGEDIATLNSAGVVNVLYGSAAGLSATGNQIWHQDSTGIAGAAESLDHFGLALAAGDFNGDGYADLVVGVPAEHIGTLHDAGVVNVLYGSATGLSATGNQMWHQDSTGIDGTAEADDRFGEVLAAGDFDGDGYADLVVDVLYEDIGTVGHAGGVNVLYGSSTGLSATGNQFWSQDSAGIAGTAEADDWFGEALAAGDFDGDGYADLGVGVPGEDIGTVNSAGGVNVLYGSAAGLSATGNQFWSQDSAGIRGAAEAFDRFGDALAAGDFDGDGYADLAVGVPGEDIDTVEYKVYLPLVLR